jgi:uncharacterized repeat protein (TIGR01451 family)
VYVASFPNVTRITNVGAAADQLTANLNYGGTFSFVTGLTADPQDLNEATVYVGADPTQGGINGTGQIWQVSPLAPAPGPPATPSITTAVAGPGNNQATISWVPTLNGQPITSYVIRTLLAPPLPGGTPTPSTVPDLTVTAPAQTATINGLTAGTSYVFEIQACNLNGCSAFSGPSAAITAFVQTAPPAPTNVLAVAVGDGLSAAVSWTQSANGFSPITSSTISAHDSLTPTLTAATAVVTGAGTGGTVTGLTCGHSYSFTVVATNAIGSSPSSAASAAVAIPCVSTADVSLTMSAPASINPGSVLTFTMNVHNSGPASVSSVTISDTLPAPFQSTTFSQGVCAGAIGVSTFSCNLGAMAPGASATVTVSVLLPAAQTTGSFTNTATASAADATGANVDPNLANNTASATTSLAAVGPTCNATTTDLQVGGASNNGNPVHGTPVTYTWQIKNNLGTVAANCVNFTNTVTAPTGDTLTLNSVTSSVGTCSIVSNAVSCDLGTINGGGQAIVTVTATPSAAAPANSYSSTGKVSFTGSDTNPANNTFTVFIGAQ